jgi:hypothetical protein
MRPPEPPLILLIVVGKTFPEETSGKRKGASQKACAKLDLYFQPSRLTGVNMPFFQVYFVR